jgi:hypothetical protein
MLSSSVDFISILILSCSPAFRSAYLSGHFIFFAMPYPAFRFGEEADVAMGAVHAKALVAIGLLSVLSRLRPCALSLIGWAFPVIRSMGKHLFSLMVNRFLSRHQSLEGEEYTGALPGRRISPVQTMDQLP